MTTVPDLVAVSFGNTRTQVGVFDGGRLTSFERLPNADRAKLVETIVKRHRALPSASIVAATVNDPVADPVLSAVADQLSVDVYRIGSDIPAPIGRQLDPETITGQDRLLNAAAAWDTLEQASAVIDVGTAVTVDFVDGAGVFHGGAIAPGPRLQLAALHAHTATLPEIEFAAPEAGETFGRNTAQAMLQGVYFGIRGMVWKLVERYAEAYEAFPTVIATGGDAELLFRDDELIDRIVPELTLLGIGVAARHALAVRPEDET